MAYAARKTQYTEEYVLNFHKTTSYRKLLFDKSNSLKHNFHNVFSQNI